MPPLETAVPGWAARDGFLVSERLRALGARHGLTTRRLGNMKDPARRLEAAAKLGLPEPLVLKQVHGTAIHSASPENAGREGDGWIVSKPGLAVAVYVADCVPLYLWSGDGSAAGVFHAGRRGTAAGMARAAVAAFRERLGIPASELHAACGPHIGACCYKVGAEVAGDFPASSLVRRGAESFLDLAAETGRQLLEAGLRPDRISTEAPCTASNPDGYYSFRRDKQDARMLAFLSLR